jgi:hypothetical protein
MYNLNTCLATHPAGSTLHDNWKCFEILINQIRDFDKQYSKYELLNGKSYLKEYIYKLESLHSADGT